MSKIGLSLRLRGNLPPTDHLSSLLGTKPTIAIREGEVVSKRRTQPMEVWILDFFDMEDYESDSIETQLLQAATKLQPMVPALAALE